MNWQKKFKKHILARGYDYYLEDAIQDYKLTGDTITATACGSYRYMVEITMNEEIIIDMSCSCPHAEEGNNCKHMAAVLYHWGEMGNCDKEYSNGKKLDEKDTIEMDWNEVNNDMLLTSRSTKSSNNYVADEVRKVIDRAGEEEIRRYLYRLMTQDVILFEQFQNFMNPKGDKERLKKLIKNIDKLVNRYAGQYNYIDYDNVSYFMEKLEDILFNDVQSMIDHDNYLEAFELVCYIFVTVSNIDMDDSDGDLSVLISMCNNFWSALIKYSNIERKREMLYWFTNKLDGTIRDYMEEHIIDIIINEFNEHEFNEEKINLINKQIEVLCGDNSYYEDYKRNQWILLRLRMMEESNKDWIEIADYCKQFWQSSEIRQYYINGCLDRKNYDEAIHVLHKSILMDSKLPGLVKEYKKQLRGIYATLGKKEEYLDLLWDSVKNDTSVVLENYKELRAQYPKEEWENLRDKFFTEIGHHKNIDKIYLYEKEYEKLMEYVDKSYGLYLLKEYEKILKERFPKIVLEKYRRELNGMVTNAGDRRFYKQLVSELKTMKRMEGGPQIVEELVIDWKDKYKSRPAMMDELSRL